MAEVVLSGCSSIVTWFHPDPTSSDIVVGTGVLPIVVLIAVDKVSSASMFDFAVSCDGKTAVDWSSVGGCL